MTQELPNRLTPLTIEALWNELLLQWETLGVNPTRAAVCLKLAHILLETGLKSCHDWNLGNIKSHVGDGRDWQFFSCGEEIPASRLAAVTALAPDKVHERARYVRGGVEYVSVWLDAPHPWTKFAAFRDLAAGLKGQFDYLKRRPAVLAALMTGDPKAYNEALVEASYYTAGREHYLQTLTDCLVTVKRSTAGYDWGDVS